MKVILSLYFAMLNTFSVGIVSSENNISVKAEENNLAAGSNSSSASLVAKVGSTTVIDAENMLIYGLFPAITESKFTADCIQVVGDGFVQIEKINNIFATGTKVKLCENTTNNVLGIYDIVIFGDVNSDGNIDSIDAGKTVDFENGLVDWDPVLDKAFYKAGDLNGDGNVDSLDAGIMVDLENKMLKLDQTTGYYSLNTYTVTFKDYDGTVISSNSIKPGMDAPLPPNPMRTGYDFVGWNGNYKNITVETDITAIYVLNNAKNIFLLGSAIGNVGDTITLMLTLKGTVLTCGFDLRLKFDKSVLEFVNFNSEQGLDVVANYIATSNIISFNFGSSKNTIVSKNVIAVTFKILETEATDTVVTLSAVEVIYADTNNGNEPKPVEFTLTDGMVFING